VNGNSRTEYVAHDDEVRVRIVDGDAIHSEVLRQTRVCVLFNDVLDTNSKRIHYDSNGNGHTLKNDDYNDENNCAKLVIDHSNSGIGHDSRLCK